MEDKSKKLAFLEEAIETARLEVLEEIESLREGGDPTVSLQIVLKVIEDLSNSSKHYESYAFDEEIVEEEHDPRFKYRIGETVSVMNLGEIYCSYKAFAEFHGYPDAIPTLDLYDYVNPGDDAVVLARGNHLSDSSLEPIYIVECNSCKFMIGEQGISPIRFGS